MIKGYRRRVKGIKTKKIMIIDERIKASSEVGQLLAKRELG